MLLWVVPNRILFNYSYSICLLTYKIKCESISFGMLYSLVLIASIRRKNQKNMRKKEKRQNMVILCLHCINHTYNKIMKVSFSIFICQTHSINMFERISPTFMKSQTTPYHQKDCLSRSRNNNLSSLAADCGLFNS